VIRETATHSCRDTFCRPIEPGRQYAVRIGAEIRTADAWEDDFAELWLSGVEDRAVRVSELPPEAQLSRLDNCTAEEASFVGASSIEILLRSAAAARQLLSSLESQLCTQLGCTAGDGSELWDGISSAVRDGRGTAIDLLDLAGMLRR
jgi:hypothetical protein